MAEAGAVIVLPRRVTAPAGVDLADQALRPSSDRRKVVELWRVRLDREVDRQIEALLGCRQDD